MEILEQFEQEFTRLVYNLKAINERWITIHPHGEDSEDYRRLKLEDGETPKEAIDRVFKKEDKGQKSAADLKAEKSKLYQDILKAKKDGDIDKARELKKRYDEIEEQLKGDKKEQTPKDDKEIIKKIEELSKKYRELEKEYWGVSWQDQDKRKLLSDKKEKVKEDLNKIGTSLSTTEKTWKNADGDDVTFMGYDADSMAYKVKTEFGTTYKSYSYYQNYDSVEQLEKADKQAYKKVQEQQGQKPKQTKPNKIGQMPKAKSVKEAEQLALEYGLADKVNFGKLSLDICNAMNESANDNLAEFPEIRKNCIKFGSLQGINKSLVADAIDIKGASLSVAIRDRIENLKKERGAEYVAQFYGDEKTIEKKINEKVKNKVKDLLSIGRASGEIAHCMYSPPKQRGIVWNEKFKDSKNFDYTVGFHPEGATSLKAICDHEFGHQINKYVEEKGYNSENYSKLRAYYNSLKSSEIGNGLSRYAQKNMSEWIAEGWAEYKNSPNCRPMAQKIGELLTASYKEVTNG